MSGLRYWLFDLRPDECAEWDWYEVTRDHYEAAQDARTLETYAVSVGSEPLLYHGDMGRDHIRLLLAAIAAPTEADVRGL